MKIPLTHPDAVGGWLEDLDKYDPVDIWAEVDGPALQFSLLLRGGKKTHMFQSPRFSLGIEEYEKVASYGIPIVIDGGLFLLAVVKSDDGVLDGRIHPMQPLEDYAVADPRIYRSVEVHLTTSPHNN